MYDERINEKLSIISRNNLIIISIISGVFLGLRLLIDKGLYGNFHELYLLICSLVILLGALVYKSTQELVDERIEKNVLDIYRLGFLFTVLTGFILYYVLLFINSEYVGSSAQNIASNSSINLMLLICFILSYINIRINKMTLNHSIIEHDRKSYYRNVLKRVLYIFIYFMLLCLLILIIQLMMNKHILVFYITLIVIIFSFLEFSIFYFLISIYEKNRYDDLLERESGIIRHISRVAVFLFIVCLILSCIQSLNTTVFYLTSYTSSSNVNGIFHAMSDFFTTYFVFIGVIFTVLEFVYLRMIYHSIKSSKAYYKPKFYPVFNILIWISFVVSILTWIYQVLLRLNVLNTFIFSPVSDNHFGVLVLTIISGLSLLISMLIPILMIIFLSQNVERKLAWLVGVRLFVLLFGRLVIISSTFRMLFSDPTVLEKMYYISNNVFLVITGLISLYIIKVFHKRYDQVKTVEMCTD